MNKLLKRVLRSLAIILIAYLILSYCVWLFNIAEWSTAPRIILGIVLIIQSINIIIDEL